MIVEALLHLSPHSYLYCFGCVTNLFQVIHCIFNLSVLEDVIHEAKFYYLGVIFIVFLDRNTIIITLISRAELSRLAILLGLSNKSINHDF